jgi:Complex I intermediate-associated protein 30 (CIA30)
MQSLLQKGYPVRAVVADLAGIPQHLSTAPHLTWVTADLTQPNTLAPESRLGLLEGVSTLVLCLAPEGTPTANSPELTALLQLLKAHWPDQGVGVITPLFDFRAPTPALLQIWGALDDVVMGGVSESRLQRLPASVLFTGNVSTANSGGFASVRTQNFQPALNLGNSTGIELRLRGDGNRYKFFIRADSRWDGVGYAYSFDTVAETWQTLRLPFADFIPVMRANRVPNAPNLNPEQIYSFQIMLSKFEYDRQLNPKFTPGYFALEIEQINTYSDTPLPSLIGLGEAEPELVAQCQNLGLTFQLLPYSNWEKTLPDSIHSPGKPR